MCYLKILLTHLKRNALSILIAVLQLAIALFLINVSYSTAERTFSLCNFAKGFDNNEIYAICNKNTIGDLYSMTPEENARFYAQWQKGYAMEQNIEIPAEFDDNSYNKDTSLFNITNSFDAVRWLNQHTFDYEDGVFVDLSFKEMTEIAYKNELELKDIMNIHGISSDIIIRESVHFEDTVVNDCYFHFISVIDNSLFTMSDYRSDYGKDLMDTENKSNVIEAIATGDNNALKAIPIGTSFDIQLYNYESMQYETKTIKIVGAIESPYYDICVTMTRNGNAESLLDDYVGRVIVEKGSNEIGLISKPFENYDRYSYMAEGMSGNYFIKIDESISDKDFRDFENALLEKGYILSDLKTAYDNSYDDARGYVTSNIIYIIISIMTAFISTGCAITILVLKDRDIFFVYYLCGYKNKNRIWFTGIISLLIVTVSEVLNSLALMVYKSVQYSYTSEYMALSFGITNSMISLIFGVLIFIIVLAISYNNVKYNDEKVRG